MNAGNLAGILALTNDVLQAVIVIFGSAVVLYHIGRGVRSQVTLAFSALISFVVIVYLTELMVSRTLVTLSTDLWLRVEWIGIVMIPAAQYHLSDALLSTTGALPHRRRPLVYSGYLTSLIFLGLMLWTDLIVGDLAPSSQAPHLQAGTFFFAFALYYWGVSAASIYNVWRARQRCITRTTRSRMTTTLVAFLAAPLGVFPYLTLSNNTTDAVPIWLWLALLIGNLVVGVMFALLTSNLIYFDAVSPDRVVRVRLYKYMARVPLAGTIVLLVYVLVSRGSPIFGLPTETALGFALVFTVMIVEWAIHSFKQPLERLFQLNDDPDVRRIQMLSERLLTTSDLHQFLESILAAVCEALRTPTSFVAAITEEGPQLEVVVGPLTENAEAIWRESNWRDLTQVTKKNGDTAVPDDILPTMNTFILWQNYWIRPLYNRKKDHIVGILGVRARAQEPDLNEEEQETLGKLSKQAAFALEDRILQQEVFAAVEGILPEIMALQERRSAATFGGLPVLTAPPGEEPTLLSDPEEFNTLVRDALSHYWGGPKLTESPLMRLEIVQRAIEEHGTPANALRAILNNAIELQKPEGERSLSTTEWILYNILELKFVQGRKVRDVARRLAVSESDLYRKQRIALENVARTVARMEASVLQGDDGESAPEAAEATEAETAESTTPSPTTD